MEGGCDSFRFAIASELAGFRFVRGAFTGFLEAVALALDGDDLGASRH